MSEILFASAFGLFIGMQIIIIYYNKNDHELLREQKPILVTIDQNILYVYDEVLELHKKVNGLFKLNRNKLRQCRYLFPNARNALMEGFIEFHDGLIIVLISIISGILIIILFVRLSSFTHRALTDEQDTEYAWTVIPLLILLCIGFPSLRLLYMVDVQRESGITVKALGHQWYWEYDYPDMNSFGSYLWGADYRQLDADRRLLIALDRPTQILIRAADVLHSWTIPRLAAKADAVPGRVNKLSLVTKRPGVYFGQCREICGRNHRFIPITMECIY